jgi:hypothetical protein
MRVYFFLTLRADNLPETRNRQYENKGGANLTRRHGVDCTTIRQEKNLRRHFSAKRKATRIPVRRNIAKNDSNCLNW